MRVFRPDHPMCRVTLLCSTWLATLAACATPASTHHLRIVNATYDDVMALAVAPSGSTDFHPLPLTQPLQGGRHALTVSIVADSCRHDVRVTFRDGRSLIYPDLDVCRHDGLRLATGPQPGRSTRLSSMEAAGTP